MPRSVAQCIAQAHGKIARIRADFALIEHLCSGTLHPRIKVCGKPGCRCARDPWRACNGRGHMVGGKLVHRVGTPQQAQLLQHAIDNHRHAKRLMRAWEEQTEILIDLEAPRQP